MTSFDREPLHLTNAHWYEDRLSVAADIPSLHDVGEGGTYIDRQFGNAWSWTPAPGAALYGRTQAVPRGPFDDGEAVLRVPFRRIPVIDLHSVDEVLAFGSGNASKDPSVIGMWRGQSRHWTLKRESVDKLRLYGDLEADEPSLLPSAARKDIYFPSMFETWSGLIDIYVDEHLKDLAVFDASQSESRRQQAASFRASYNYRGWGLATAQHYGLPSVGLDLTSDIMVALYFALHRFETNPSTGAMSVRRATDEDDPIIYGLGVFENDLLEDEKLAPAWLNCARPKAQKAFFFGSAWGDSVNRAADRVYVAARLRGHASWTSPLNTEAIFPSASDDAFLAFLLRSRERFASTAVVDLLKWVYFAAG
ncbi:FRG domain-containing protein [Bosea lathyri]|uniref:FRG domain-containing protein n=1 Tax=Bosea lathyri TaxID=1036778 RepID=A0A1H5V9N0_9HYPH|nr:FRG domain-containing protein [Bosea lathyri]SEF84085.1 FRG domain-containing protein [Bosea lathyri]